MLYNGLCVRLENLRIYIRQMVRLLCRDSYWPGGVLAEEAPERPKDVRQRLRMVTRAKMYGSIPGEFIIVRHHDINNE